MEGVPVSTDSEPTHAIPELAFPRQKIIISHYICLYLQVNMSAVMQETSVYRCTAVRDSSKQPLSWKNVIKVRMEGSTVRETATGQHESDKIEQETARHET